MPSIPLPHSPGMPPVFSWHIYLGPILLKSNVLLQYKTYNHTSKYYMDPFWGHSENCRFALMRGETNSARKMGPNHQYFAQFCLIMGPKVYYIYVYKFEKDLTKYCWYFPIYPIVKFGQAISHTQKWSKFIF